MRSPSPYGSAYTTSGSAVRGRPPSKSPSHKRLRRLTEVGNNLPASVAITFNDMSYLQGLIEKRGAPENLRSDNGPEFVAMALQAWAEKASIKINYIAPGSPWENGRVESFHGKSGTAA